MIDSVCAGEDRGLVYWKAATLILYHTSCYLLSSCKMTVAASFTWHQALTFIQDVTVLHFKRGDDDGAGVSVVVIVQYGGLCIIVIVVVGGS